MADPEPSVSMEVEPIVTIIDRTAPVPDKRKHILVDPDNDKELPEAKRKNLDLDTEIKVKCLRALIDGYEAILALYTAVGGDKSKLRSLQLSHAITSIIFTIHNVKRAVLNSTELTNMAKKSAANDFQITQQGKNYVITNKQAEQAWDKVVKAHGLSYKKIEGKKNWIGTIGPYLSMFGMFGHRLQELRIGHMRMPIGKTREGTPRVVPLEKYCLEPAHAILLEGITYPPERRSSMAMSLGPMTQMIQMVTSEGKYRAKWENAVKHTLQHLPCIDDFIALTRTVKQASAIGPTLRLYADLAMIATTRHSQRGALPLVMLVDAYNHYKGNKEADGKAFLEKFNCSGEGLFLTYKTACLNHKGDYSLEADMTVESASQMVFHAIFGTYKEDLGILGRITTTKNWKTREEIAQGFKKKKKDLVKIKLIEMTHYSKLCSANQTMCSPQCVTRRQMGKWRE